MSEKSKKVIIIGLDGATWILLKPWLEMGELPTLKKLMQKGAYGTLMGAIPCRSGTSIPTFYTGKNPCKWSMFDFPSFDCDVINYQKIRAKALAIWDILGQYGYQSAILNIPTTHPPTETRGVMVSGFSLTEEDEYSYPKDFKKSIKGFHSERETFFNLVCGKTTIEKEEDLLNFYTENAKKRYRLIKKVIEDRAFDFSIFWIDESDSVHHTFWEKKALLLAFSREMDNLLKDIVDNNPDANIIVMSDHGFDARPTHEFYPKSWLEREGYLKLKGGRIRQWLIQRINALIISLPYRYKYIARLYSIYKKIKGQTARTAKKENEATNLENRNWRLTTGVQAKSKVIGIDWQKTMATNQDFWGIKIIRENLDRDYKTVRREIMEKMRKLTDENGEKVIKYIWEREEIFNGEQIQKFPDIVYLPTKRFEPTGFLPPYITKKKIKSMKTSKSSGDHLIIREGIFIAHGPDINNAGEIGEIDILDVVPTVLHLFGVPSPGDLDGRVLKEIII